MAADDDIKALLAADATFTAIVTGGVYTRKELKRMGINRVNTALFDVTTKLLKPVCVVHPRDALSTRDVIDTEAKLRSFRQVIEVYFYNDGDSGHTNLETARLRAFTVLQGAHLSSGGAPLSWFNDSLNRYDYALDNAAYERSDYELYDVKG